jgi:mono/diheme cytochrome c family protein
MPPVAALISESDWNSRPIAWPLAAMLAMALASHAAVACADGRGLFVSHCATCHQVTGKGVPGIYPPLAASVGRYVSLPGGRAYLIHTVLNGMGGKIQVGTDIFEGDMASWSQLSDQQVADVINYVLIALNDKLLPGYFKPITAAEVRAGRSKRFSSDELHAERDALLKALQDQAAESSGHNP